MIEITERLSREETAAVLASRAKRNRLVLLSLLAGVAMIFLSGLWHVNAELRVGEANAITGP